MNKKITCFALLLFCVLSAFSQTVVYRGLLYDAETRQPVEFAHVLCVENPEVTAVTDEKGKFYIKTSKVSGSQEFRISNLGYKTQTEVFKANKNNRVKLQPNTIQLEGVVIKPDNPAEELLRKAIRAIPSNYPSELERIYGRVTETVAYDSAYKLKLYDAYADVEADKQQYKSKNSWGNVKLTYGENKYYVKPDTFGYEVFGSFDAMYGSDIIAEREKPLNSLNFNNVQLKILDTIVVNNEEIARIYFGTNKHEGVFHISLLDYGIYQSEYNMINEMTPCGPLIPSFLCKRMFRRVQSFYVKNEATYRLDSSHYETAFITSPNDNPDTIYLEGHFIADSIKVANKPIPYGERTERKAVMVNEVPLTIYDSSLFIVTLDSGKLDSVYISPDFEETDELVKFLSTGTYSLYFQTLYYKSDGYSINLQSPFSSTIEKSAFEKPILTVAYRSEFPVSKSLSAGFRFDFSIKKRLYNSFNIFAMYRRPIGITDRWMVAAAVHLGERSLRNHISEFELENEIRWNGRKFDSETVDIYAMQKEFFLSPELGIEYKVNKMLTLKLYGQYYFVLDENEGIFLRETERGGLFSNKKQVFTRGAHRYLGDRSLSLEVPLGIALRIAL